MKKSTIIRNIFGGLFIFTGFVGIFSSGLIAGISMMIFGISLLPIFYEKAKLNIKYIQISLQIDGSKETIEIQPEEKYVEHLQSLIDERRGINVLELNSIHKKVAAKLSALYSKSS